MAPSYSSHPRQARATLNNEQKRLVLDHCCAVAEQDEAQRDLQKVQTANARSAHVAAANERKIAREAVREAAEVGKARLEQLLEKVAENQDGSRRAGHHAKRCSKLAQYFCNRASGSQ